MKYLRGRLNAMRHSEIAWGVFAGIACGVMIAALSISGTNDGARFEGWHRVWSPSPAIVNQSNFSAAGLTDASDDVHRLLPWINESRDAQGLPFVIVDKKEAKLYVFDKNARLSGIAPVLLGSAVGDDSVRGIGERPIDQVQPQERTTPAGRFVGERGRNTLGEDVVWVDYDAAVSMHRVRTTNAAEKRLERIASADKHDKRISYGCINVPAEFYDAQLRPIFAAGRAMIYVLPEVKPLEAVFGLQNDAALPARIGTAQTEITSLQGSYPPSASSGQLAWGTQQRTFSPNIAPK